MTAPDVDPAILAAMAEADSTVDGLDAEALRLFARVAQRIRDEAVAENAVLRSLVAKLMKGEVTQLITGGLSFIIHHAGQRVRRDVSLTPDEAKTLAEIKEADRG